METDISSSGIWSNNTFMSSTESITCAFTSIAYYVPLIDPGRSHDAGEIQAIESPFCPASDFVSIKSIAFLVWKPRILANSPWMADIHCGVVRVNFNVKPAPKSRWLGCSISFQYRWA
jgi:hypothetical protein